MASTYDGRSLLSTSGYSNGGVPTSPTQAPVAPEHVKRLLGAMSPEGVFFTYEDLCSFTFKHKLPFSEELLFSMFSEANNTSDGLMDMDQLQKASNFKFQNRRHNLDWVRLFELAPRQVGSRVTALSPRMLEQEPIRANFEQEPQILTFEPLTNTMHSRAPGTGATFNMTASAYSSASGAARTLSSSAVFNTAHSLPPKVHHAPNVAADRLEEEMINRRLRPEGHMRAPPTPKPATLRTQPGVQVASFEQRSSGPPAMRCGFDACAAFDRSCEELQRVSDGVGWRSKGRALVREQERAATAPMLLHGLHERDWLYLPGGRADHIPTRVDGVVSRVIGEAATVPLRLLICENSQHSLANSRKHHQAEFPARADGSEGAPFVSVFAKASIADRALKVRASQDRLEIASGTEYPPSIAFMNGKPSAHEFRPRKPDAAKQVAATRQQPPPAFLTETLGRHWPVREGKPASSILQANPPMSCAPMRLMMTENDQPAARSTRVDLR